MLDQIINPKTTEQHILWEYRDESDDDNKAPSIAASLRTTASQDEIVQDKSISGVGGTRHSIPPSLPLDMNAENIVEGFDDGLALLSPNGSHLYFGENDHFPRNNPKSPTKTNENEESSNEIVLSDDELETNEKKVSRLVIPHVVSKEQTSASDQQAAKEKEEKEKEKHDPIPQKLLTSPSNVQDSCSTQCLETQRSEPRDNNITRWNEFVTDQKNRDLEISKLRRKLLAKRKRSFPNERLALEDNNDENSIHLKQQFRDKTFQNLTKMTEELVHLSLQLDEYKYVWNCITGSIKERLDHNCCTTNEKESSSNGLHKHAILKNKLNPQMLTHLQSFCYVFNFMNNLENRLAAILNELNNFTISEMENMLLHLLKIFSFGSVCFESGSMSVGTTGSNAPLERHWFVINDHTKLKHSKELQVIHLTVTTISKGYELSNKRDKMNKNQSPLEKLRYTTEQIFETKIELIAQVEPVTLDVRFVNDVVNAILAYIWNTSSV
ncbi:hypothetical protein RFI_08268 [Reticulomyxa filosa]|uniref:Uncharacterized protein n=1 Tax=Reticulomyxa filosa TaxID=46433 RepID=X6NSB0_RETFI|nr:hypothetical protein RFI_08268 [Reticulomyxa filosa]|eukprot:ETO28861.1 hypothetical protein RFI_08268 [Reticulomyxa filosa]